jgi:hypothetical protein
MFSFMGAQTSLCQVRRMIGTNRLICLSALVLLAASGVVAQEYPRAEAFLGYDFTRANSATDIPAFSINGVTRQFDLNFNRRIGFVDDLGAVHNGNINC